MRCLPILLLLFVLMPVVGVRECDEKAKCYEVQGQVNGNWFLYHSYLSKEMAGNLREVGLSVRRANSDLCDAAKGDTGSNT